jgi:hypothetical protein
MTYSDTVQIYTLPSSSTLVFEPTPSLPSALLLTLSPAAGGWMTALPGVESHRSSEVRAKASLERRLIIHMMRGRGRERERERARERQRERSFRSRGQSPKRERLIRIKVALRVEAL